jgi:hypothetical protein
MLNWLWILVALLLFGTGGFIGDGPDTPECGTEEGCGAATVTVDAWAPVTINGHEGVIVPVDETPSLLMETGIESEDYWMPSESDLQLAEDELEQHMSRSPGLGAGMLDAMRQYGGFIEDGERKIYVNSFCAEFDNWRSNVVFVLDGGACFWQAIYNVDTGEIEAIYVNFDA